MKIRNNSVAKQDYDKAFGSLCRALEWRIKSDVKALQKFRPLGLVQAKRREDALTFTAKVLSWHAEICK